ncbi:putative Ubiquitin-like domain-containing protein [Seiridium unicorne]|uniref:Ubiquitin-like domain-containing protein n=1 Tax=Seiridium unicorne TaxID=138068 RepID=A0ABR2UKT6_9PEZI
MSSSHPEWECGIDGTEFTVTHTRVPAELRVSFMRTVRVPDNATQSKLPPGLAPVPEKESLWVNFEATKPFAIKIYAGGVNAISGEHMNEDLDTKFRRLKKYFEGKSIQDYLIVPDQLWLDGIATSPEVVRQFVAMPTGPGYSVEAQMTGQEVVGGLQFDTTPPMLSISPGWGPKIEIIVTTLTRKNLPVECTIDCAVDYIKWIIQVRVFPQTKRTRKDYSIQDGSRLFLVLGLSGGGPGEEATMGLAAGGKIKQALCRDHYPKELWDSDFTFSVPVHIVNSNQFRRITGAAPPPSPVSASVYAEAGLPFFNMYEENSDISGTFAEVRSVNEIEQERGLASGAEPSITTALVKLDTKGHRIVHESRQKAREHFEDPDHLLDWVTPRGDFRTIKDLENEVWRMRSER